MCVASLHRSPPVDKQNSASTVETDQPKYPIVDIETTEYCSNEENVSIPSDPEDMLDQLLDSRKRRLEAERKVEELSEEIKRLRKGSVVVL